jgi:MoaA/NifB/PqqE/SkfB family radical SAM enzyme
MVFAPDEVLFSPVWACNLSCPHCDNKKVKGRLAGAKAIRFLKSCKDAGINKVGFTGGEPFLAPVFLFSVAKEAVRQGMFFDRIMTNGVWYTSKADLRRKLKGLFHAGFDGSICVSVDAFHKQPLGKLTCFIRTAESVWRRPDVVSIACVMGARNTLSRRKLARLAGLLNGKLVAIDSFRRRIEAPSIFIRILKIDLSPVGRAHKLKNPWTGAWFKDDRCKGPGNVLFVLPDGRVKPCCGYATDSERLTIGDVEDSAEEIIINARRNRFVSAIFSQGLSGVRKRLKAFGVKFPGKADNNCFFCWYILNRVPKEALGRCLD